jgi:hypothetical protein
VTPLGVETVGPPPMRTSGRPLPPARRRGRRAVEVWRKQEAEPQSISIGGRSRRASTKLGWAAQHAAFDRHADVVEAWERSIHTREVPGRDRRRRAEVAAVLGVQLMVAPIDAAGQSAIAAMVSIIARRPPPCPPRNRKPPVVLAAPLPNAGASTLSRRASPVNVCRCGAEGATRQRPGTR